MSTRSNDVFIQVHPLHESRSIGDKRLKTCLVFLSLYEVKKDRRDQRTFWIKSNIFNQNKC